MTITLPPLADAYVRATNEHDAAAFMALFADDAVVDDNGKVLRGRDSIRTWSEKEIFDAQVTLDVMEATERDGGVVITTRVDGTFDRTGLPDPVVITHDIQVANGKIARLTCRLA